MTDFHMIRAASIRAGGKVRCTPLLHSPLLNAAAGRRIYVKAECLQLTGSFKFRGAWSAISAFSHAERKRGVVAFSSGNHAQGVALAAQMHGIPATIVMPDDAPRTKLENTRAYGADVVVYNRYKDDRDAIGIELSRNRGLNLIKPYDDPEVIAGQGTIGLELGKQMEQEGIHACDVLVPCGGGGLTSGVALALEKTAPGFVVRTCEPEHFDDSARSLAAGERVANSSEFSSICDSIVTSTPGALTFPIMQRLCGNGLVVSERQVMSAMRVAFEHFKLVLEPGGSVALAAALYSPSLQGSDRVVVIASGGNVDMDLFNTATKAHPEPYCRNSDP
ncbi:MULTISPECIES: threonine/serine dehydratase [unclassified Neorhizobium]|uniref:threonine ammonia-lyase n=1 Tax=unclassified Neorhizobium TaxID=2629175 RepID=UPI001FF3FD79|nr:MULTISPECIES: threonine/serine dehydratase [unclassified Neorhizobium]MCJ9670046.1 threonine/serine dehydratase [Neorhizobium sp. SHOUNA12B]MCJ9746031.1 threonine/serine dehydratase [Neorhizobium sp. SHOUNA12A]